MNDELESLDLDDDSFDNPTQEPVSDPLIDDSNNNEPSGFTEDINEDPDTEPDNGTDVDIITSLLKSKGINNPQAIKIEDENGNIQEVDFYSLTPEERLNILNSSDVDDNYGLDNDETEFINYLRENNVSIKDYVDYVQKQAIDAYISENSEQHYKVDDLSDDELYLLDLKYNIKDLTDEEANSYLEHDKSNEALFNKKVATLRDNYKVKEQEKLEEQELIESEKQKQEQEKFASTIVNAVSELNSIEAFDLEKEDKERIADFILGVDATGTNYLSKALNDPTNIAKIAWFLLDGEESIKSLNDYWADVVQKHSKTKYEEGFRDGKDGKKSKTVVDKTPTRKTQKPSSDNFIPLTGHRVEIDY